eukprot:74538_1
MTTTRSRARAAASLTAPHAKVETNELKVEIGAASPSSFSFHSISGSPTTADEISDNYEVHGPATPPIDDGSYMISPVNHGANCKMTPICTSPVSVSPKESNHAAAFPDTPGILDAIDEKKESAKSGAELERETLSAHGFVRGKYIADTLQGETFFAVHAGRFGEAVIKKTRKDLYARGITISKEGKAFNIREDIVFESRMMREFMLHSPPASLIKFYTFFEDASSYYLCMENGGKDFFDFVVDCHELIASGKLRMKEWRKQCKFMFAQMIECIEWLHNTMHYCHLDISLENILISHHVSFDGDTQTLNKCYIKFIDFGLAQQFDAQKNPQFLSKKYVGKTHYKSPKVYAKKEEFAANKADVWSLGVCLFMMIIGAPPYNKPHNKDPGFRFIKQKKITKLLYSWNRIKYVTPNLFDLMERMLTVDEEQRISIDEICNHDWCKIYFPSKTRRSTPHKLSVSMPPSTPMSPSYSTSFSNSMATPTTPKAPNFNPNGMVAQHAFSTSVNTPRTPRKASTSYPYPAAARHKNSHSNHKYHQQQSSGSQQGRTPTPIIIESHTSANDCTSYCAAIDPNPSGHDKTKTKKKKKKSITWINHKKMSPINYSMKITIF